MALFNILWCSVLLILVFCDGLVFCQQQLEESICYGPGSIATSVIVTSILTVFLCCVSYIFWKKYKRRQKEHLILETTDPEKGKAEFAFDNPGFKDTSLASAHKLDNTHKKWTQWPLAVLTTKTEKKKTLDDSAIDKNEVKVVALRSHDFTGLGFNVCGNMKDGIFIKDVLHRGPASESGKLNPGDRIISVTISFEHMVYEDALTILSYASPYEITIEAKGEKIAHHGQGAYPRHPIFKSSSCANLLQIDKSPNKHLSIEDYNGRLSSNYSSLQKSRSNMTTLERKESQSPKSRPTKKPAPKVQLSPSQLKNELEQTILADHEYNLKLKDNQLNNVAEINTQKTENKFQKFGVRVLPEQEKSPKSVEQNENNVNIEKYMGIDEVDKNVPQAKKREKKIENKIEFSRNDSMNGSDIKRDKNGIPQEIPNFMMNAAVAARTNRKNSEDRGVKEQETPKRKGKAPAPPSSEPQQITKSDLDEIHLVNDEILYFTLNNEEEKSLQEEIEVELRNKESQMKDYNLDSDIEGDNQSSVNTIELNSSDITIHHAEENDDRKNRKTASTGDLTKIQKNKSNTTGTLERAQSLDITDTGIPTLTKKKKGTRIDNEMKSDNDLFSKTILDKEPRLSLILDGLNTFQKSRLKSSKEWGNLEDAILKLNEDNGYTDEDIGFHSKTKEFDALVDKINEIKMESNNELSSIPIKIERKIKNQIWPFSEDDRSTIIKQQEETELALDLDCGETFTFNEEKLELEIKQQDENTTEIEIQDEPSTTDKECSKIFVENEPNKIELAIENKERYERRQQKPIKYEQTILPPSNDEISEIIQVPENNDYIEVFPNTLDLTEDFIKTEKLQCSNDYKATDTNIPDDIKVSRHSLDSMEKAKSDDAKSMIQNISNVTVSECNNVNRENLYTTPINDDTKVTITTPEIKNNIDEILDVKIDGPTSLTLEIPSQDIVKVTENKYSIVNESTPNNDDDSPKSTSLTYITEIQVATPTNNNSTKNISEIEIIPNKNNDRNLDSDFENYIKNFESNTKTYDVNIKYDDKSELNSLIITDEIDAEKELHKIQEIAEEQLKKLPEMRFTTSSYETPSKIPEKRHNQIELLRSNFEKNSNNNNNKGQKTEVKSRIPIATTIKTPPTSPERRDSRNLDIENDKAILELMSSNVHSTSKYQIKSPNTKNVTVTSIRTSSKIPSGLPVLNQSRPPIPPRKQDLDEQMVQMSTTNGVDNSFKQWIFNPSENSITNITVTEGKTQKYNN